MHSVRGYVHRSFHIKQSEWKLTRDVIVFQAGYSLLRVG